jgi:MFS family permease
MKLVEANILLSIGGNCQLGVTLLLYRRFGEGCNLPNSTIWRIAYNGLNQSIARGGKRRMTTQTQVVPPIKTEEQEAEFQTDQVLTIVGGHFVHDTFTAFVAPLLPLIIEKLSLTLAQAGSLWGFLQLPALLNPFIGYLADSISLRYFVILAPAVTATFISLLGFAPNYATVAILLFATGVSGACFHAPAPPMIAHISGDRLGKGMSWFMAGGEFARTVGPLLAVWAVSMWSFDGIYRLMFLGWAASLILYWRLREIPARSDKKQDLRAMLPAARRSRRGWLPAPPGVWRVARSGCHRPHRARRIRRG